MAFWVSGLAVRLQNGLHRFNSGKRLVNKEKYYVRRLVAWTRDGDDDVWSNIYEIYTQPRRDYVKARVFSWYVSLLIGTSLERALDWVWEKRTGLDFDDDDWLPPSVSNSLNSYRFDTRNQTVVGRVETPREEGLL